MPESSHAGKDWIKERIPQLTKIQTVLDIGPGVGTYLKLLKPLLPRTTWIGVEAWKNYVRDFSLDKLYDLVICQDVCMMPPTYGADLVIFGDVLEHMTKDKAINVYNKFYESSRFVVIVIPIVETKQGIHDSNPHEQHVANWTHSEVLKKFKGIKEHWKDDKKGAYLAY